MEDKTKDKVQREHTNGNPKWHILLVSVFLCCKMTVSSIAMVVSDT